MKDQLILGCAITLSLTGAAGAIFMKGHNDILWSLSVLLFLFCLLFINCYRERKISAYSWFIIIFVIYQILLNSYYTKNEWISAFLLGIGSSLFTVAIIEMLIFGGRKEDKEQLDRIEEKLNELLKDKRK